METVTGELARFETQGPTWAERARAGELNAVLSPSGPERFNVFLHAVQLFGARVALAMRRRRGRGVLLDYGCGTGRFLRYFGARGYAVIGTEITAEMLLEARRIGLPPRSVLALTDGVSIPLHDASVDMIWVCGVLKYALFRNPFLEFERQAEPAYSAIAREMYRVLKPGGLVVSVEMYVNDVRPELFIQDFEASGFVTRTTRILQRYSRLEFRYQSPRWPLWCVRVAGQLCAAYRFWFDDPKRPVGGLRDYLFVWLKPRSPGSEPSS